MVDIVIPLFTAGFSLAERIVFSWLKEGKSDVRISHLEASIAELSAREAKRLRLHEDDLMRITDHIIRELIVAAPQLSYVKTPLQRNVVRLDFDPKNPASSNELLRDLKARLGEMASRKKGFDPATESKGADVSLERSKSAPFEVLPPIGSQEHGERSSELLDDLRRRIHDRENPRS